MAAEDSYEIMPYKEIVELKKQIAELQRKTGDTSSKELLASMAALTKSMNNMLQLFSSAAEEMKLEEKTESELSHKVAPLIEKVNKLEEQNKTIAGGMVAIADMVKEIKGEGKIKPTIPKPFDKGLPPLEPPMEEELPPLGPPKPTKPITPPPLHRVRVVPRGPPPGMPHHAPMPPPGMPPHGMPPPPSGMPHHAPMPPPGMPPPTDLGPLPPLPGMEEKPKKKGLFGIFKKKK